MIVIIYSLIVFAVVIGLHLHTKKLLREQNAFMLHMFSEWTSHTLRLLREELSQCQKQQD